MNSRRAGTLQANALANRIQLGPKLIEPLAGDGHECAKLLGEQRYAKLFQQPTILHERGIEDAFALVLSGKIEVRRPTRVDLFKQLPVARDIA